MILVDAVDTTWSSAAAFDGGERVPDYLSHIDFGTVLLRKPGMAFDCQKVLLRPGLVRLEPASLLDATQQETHLFHVGGL
ncbi:MAG: hypothetical protein OXQ84_12060 [bacterium]|nr:hypothetical protein [bacterium]